MILEQQKQSVVLNEGLEGESIKMSLDMESAGFLMQMLSKNIYSDEIGSAVRETVSNALDSSRRAGSNNPVIVTLKGDNRGEYEFSVEDFGLGLDDNDVKDIISKYGKSTKREEADSLGMWGLGFKSPLAYSSSFIFVCRKDGIERTYMMYEGEDENTIDLLLEKKTDKDSGVKVIISIKSRDTEGFYKKIKEQLAYFDNVYFDVNIKSYYSTSTIRNDFKIHRSVEYQWSELAEDTSMHICLDNVYYPIDFSKLGIDRINIPIGLKFGLTDGVFPTINRESIRYTPEAKEIILNKIKRVADVLMEEYNKTVADTDNFRKIIEFYKDSQYKVNVDGKIIVINDILKYTAIPMVTPKLKNVELISLKRTCDKLAFLTDEYRVKYKLKNGRISSENTSFSTWSNIENYYIYSELIPEQKKSYIRDTFNQHTVYEFMKKTHPYKLKEKTSFVNEYYNILALKNYPKHQWRQCIKEFQYVQSLYLKECGDIDSIVVPQSWIDAKKKKRVVASSNRRLKAIGEVNCKYAEDLSRYTGAKCKFTADTLKMEDLHKFKKLTLYTEHSDNKKLNDLYDMVGRKMRLLTFSNREMNIINKFEIHNLIPYEKFMEGEHIVFKRMMTAYLIRKLIAKYPNTFNKKERLEALSKPLFNKLVELNKYSEKYSNGHYMSDSVAEAMLEVAVSKNLFDLSIYDVYIDVVSTLEKYTFIETLTQRIGRWENSDEDLMTVLSDMFRYHKFKMNYEMYISKKEVVIEEEVVVNN